MAGEPLLFQRGIAHGSDPRQITQGAAAVTGSRIIRRFGDSTDSNRNLAHLDRFTHLTGLIRITQAGFTKPWGEPD
jgi:hypothetical protein